MSPTDTNRTRDAKSLHVITLSGAVNGGGQATLVGDIVRYVRPLYVSFGAIYPEAWTVAEVSANGQHVISMDGDIPAALFTRVFNEHAHAPWLPGGKGALKITVKNLSMGHDTLCVTFVCEEWLP